jgi:hypothetical protein
MRVDRVEVELAGDQEDDCLDGGQAHEAASATLGGLEQAVDGFQEAVGLARLSPRDDAFEVKGSGLRPDPNARTPMLVGSGQALPPMLELLDWAKASIDELMHFTSSNKDNASLAEARLASEE